MRFSVARFFRSAILFGLFSLFFVAGAQAVTIEKIDSVSKAKLDEAVALLDNWRWDSGALNMAKERLDDVLRVYPRNVMAHYSYARYYMKSGHMYGMTATPDSLAAAEKSLDEALKIDPEFSEAYVLFGQLYYAQKRYQDAANALKKAREIGTSSPWLNINSAILLSAQGLFDKAASEYQAVLDSGTTNRNAMSSALEGLARVYVYTRQYDKADYAYRRQIAFEPQTGQIYGNYGGFLLCTRDDADAAIVQFRKALERANYGIARLGLSASLYRKLANRPANSKEKNDRAMLDEARSLRVGSPLEVVTSYCNAGPAVLAMRKVGAN